MNKGDIHNSRFPIRTRDRISATLLLILAGIALVVLAGIAVVAVKLNGAQNQIAVLRDSALPKVIKLSQLSQEASASIAIAPAMSTNPTRFEFETLLSRIADKKNSQAELLAELRKLVIDEEAADALERNSDLLNQNQTALATVVRQQIDVHRRIENHVDRLRKIILELKEQQHEAGASGSANREVLLLASRLQSVLLDPSRARFSRNRREFNEEVQVLESLSNKTAMKSLTNSFFNYWTQNGPSIFEEKAAALTNEFKIKALVEENSLLANRLLSSANAEFWLANEQLTAHLARIESATKFNLAAMAAVLLVFITGAFFLWLVLQHRIFKRLANMRDGLIRYADKREISKRDQKPDEIGEISRALSNYMAIIDEQEGALAKKNKDLENLSTRLAKYLSPQVYDSIFTGKQQVTLNSDRKKLTVFFSDIVGFTELADQLESEELTQLLNDYLTEMSQIALQHGATVDKFIGDAIMVFFGDPETKGLDQDAIACVDMAITMRDSLAALNSVWRRAGLRKRLVTRMGIHTGYCTVGNFGSEQRMDYTIIGGTVNTASRLETAAEPGEILISYETFALVGDAINCQEKGTIDVRGIAYPITTYSVLGRRDTQPDKSLEFRQSSRGMNIEIDRTAMNEEDRRVAEAILRNAVRHLNDD